MLDSTPILPEEIAGDSLKILRNGPQCVAFGVFIIWFSSITLNLGPTFLSGAISSGLAELQPSCPLVQVVICKRSIVFTITEKAWLKAATTSFTFKTLLIRHYAKWMLTLR